MYQLATCFSILILLSACTGAAVSHSLVGENGQIEVVVNVDHRGSPFYQVYFENTMVLDTSYLGLSTETDDFSRGLKLLAVGEAEKVSDRYQQHKK